MDGEKGKHKGTRHFGGAAEGQGEPPLLPLG